MTLAPNYSSNQSNAAAVREFTAGNVYIHMQKTHTSTSSCIAKKIRCTINNHERMPKYL